MYTIEAAQRSNLSDEIFVSTDSIEYAKIAREWGASVPFLRCKELSSLTASSWDVVKDALLNYKKIGKEIDTVALLQQTSPLRKFDIWENDIPRHIFCNSIGINGLGRIFV